MPLFSMTGALYLGLVALSFAIGSYLVNVTPANARGCNGVVNQFEWGCAYWDNNNGPQFPHYREPAPARVVAPIKPVIVRRTNPPVVQRNSTSGLVSPGRGILVSQGGGNLISNDGGSLHR